MRVKDGELIQAVQRGNFQFVLDFLDATKKAAKISKYLNQVDSRNHLTILHNLVLHKNDELACRLLLKILASLKPSQNSLVQAEDVNGMTALHYRRRFRRIQWVSFMNITIQA